MGRRTTRGRPRILTTVALASGLLFIALLVAWIRGHWIGTYLERISADQTALARLSWGDGLIGVTFIRCAPTNDPTVKVGFSVTTDEVAPGDAADRERYWRAMTVHFRHAGIVYGTRSFPGYSECCFAMPLWPLLVLALVLPATKAYQVLKAHKRRIMGLCRQCGYDLRASEGVCPECGTPITRPHSDVRTSNQDSAMHPTDLHEGPN